MRMEAVKLVRAGWSTRQAARHFGYSHSAVVKWCARAPTNGGWAKVIPTESSRPKHHPAELSDELVAAILDYRQRYRRGAAVLHFYLTRDGYQVSLSSVKRTLKRHELTKYSKWKKWHIYPPRPLPNAPGDLVEVDTILDGAPASRLCVYTCLDVYSRWAHAEPVSKISNWASLVFVRSAQEASFKFVTLQSDHGGEFAKYFTKQIGAAGIAHRHSRVRKPNDNAHLERFNRTIQEECLIRLPRKLEVWQKEIPAYLHHYNHERPHIGINMQTPQERLQAIEL